MSEDQKKQTIVERIRKIMETAGRTEAELLAAQNLCQKLMMKYNIDKNDVFVSDGDIGIIEVENTFEGHETRYWTWDLLCRIGGPYNVQVIRSQRYRPITFEKYEVYRLIGSTEDREIVKTIFENILPVIRASRKLRWKEYCKRTPKDQQIKAATFAKSYFNGYGAGLYHKLKDEREEFLRNMNATEMASKPGSTDAEKYQLDYQLRLNAAEGAITSEFGLIVRDGQLIGSSQQKWEMIVARKRQLVDDYIAEHFSNAEEASDRKSKKSAHEDAFQSGYVDGKQRYQGRQLENAEDIEITHENLQDILVKLVRDGNAVSIPLWNIIQAALNETHDSRHPKKLLPILKKQVTETEYKALEIFITWCHSCDPKVIFTAGNYQWAVAMCAAKMKNESINHYTAN